MPRILIKYVKKARMWCKTTFFADEKTGKQKQKQEWSSEKPNV